MASDILSQLCMGVKFNKKEKAVKPPKEIIVEPQKTETDLKLQGNPVKVQNRLRTHHGIGVWGDDTPDLLTDFQDLITRYKCNPQLLENIRNCGYERPTPVQMITIPSMIEKREMLVSAPTGSGKTASFLIPLVHGLKRPSTDGFRAVIVCPTRELAKQTYRESIRLTENLGLQTYVLTKTSNAQRRFSSELAKSLDILVTTPNRLVWLLNETEFHLSRVQYLIIDESDRLFEAGKSGFRDQLVKIYAACDSAKLRRAMFSATSSKDLDKWCRLHLDSVVVVAVGAKNSATKQVDQKLLFVGNDSGKLFEIRKMLRAGITPPVLIFVETKTAAKSLHTNLVLDGLNVDVIHSDRTVTERDRIIDQFRLGQIWILICTELMGRGIDFKGVRLVINYDFPQSAATYIHRIGRTGRAGLTGQAITFFMEQDGPKLKEIVRVVRKAGCEVPEFMLRINTKQLKNRLNARKNLKLKTDASGKKEASSPAKKKAANSGGEGAKKKNGSSKKMSGKVSSAPKRKGLIGDSQLRKRKRKLSERD